MENKILSPKSDLIFKLIFGDNRNIDILADFLQSVLDLPKVEYSHITIVDPHFRQETIDDKLGILDVKLHTKNGKIIDVEIQVSDVPQMRERILFYSSKMITEQIGKGGSYKLKKVISIVITDYNLITENDTYHNKYLLYDKNTGSKFTDVLEINTLELPKLPIAEDHTMLWNWLQFLKSSDEEELAMLAQKSPQIEKAVGILKVLSQDERTRLLYEEREKARLDNQARLEGAFEQGGTSKAIRIAKNALKKNMPLHEIVAITELSYEEIEGILKEMD